MKRIILIIATISFTISVLSQEQSMWIIRPQFDSAQKFEYGVALVEIEGKYGAIDLKGNVIIPIKYAKKSSKLKSLLIDERVKHISTNGEISSDETLILSFEAGKWGYKKNTLKDYIESCIGSWDSYKNEQIKKIGTIQDYLSKFGISTYEEYLKSHIEKDINDWQRKGEFETSDKWKERVSEQTRIIKIEELTLKYQNEFTDLLNEYKMSYDGLVDEYKRLYTKCRDQYYEIKILDNILEFNKSEFELETYDADNQTFLVKSDLFGDMLFPVPLEEAPNFKQLWFILKKKIKPIFVPSGDDVVLTSVIISNGDKKYVYDSQTQAKYAITDVNYNFKPVEITIPNISDVNYTFEPIEDIQLSVIQTSPHVKGIESNNLTIQKNLINAIKQSDIDVNIPLIEQKENNNTFIVIIANEDYLRVSDVPYANNDGEIFKTYCYNVLGVPEKNVKYVADASLNDLKYNLNWLKQVMEAYNGEASVIFYYAGHGIPDEANKTAYLLPVDGYGSDVTTGYSLKTLYDELGAMPAKSVSVFLDACFSGTKREGDMLASARGIAIKVKETAPQGNMIVFSAAQGDETAYPYKEQRHGMFTYYLLKKLQETKGEATLGEICDYVTSEVRKQSIVVNGKMQTPTLTPSASVGNAWRNWKLK